MKKIIYEQDTIENVLTLLNLLVTSGFQNATYIACMKMELDKGTAVEDNEEG